ncbi:membrane protein insertase YidC [Puniceicoccus vermicola]|uniref:Membrane protein insertase YidC n=1 Tax=Puniceicoccus vermicola TaxID=388746 RepID=A0A7X1AZG3_9BACT|nr:membrane protein insertase YidC [Puniceicoccus vermicola]MBC2602816.1 membrane protein insertase YidC [Puniceicoccus vermicola]
MDKKNVVIGLACILAAFGLMFYQSSQRVEPVPVDPVEQTVVEESETTVTEEAPQSGLGALDDSVSTQSEAEDASADSVSESVFSPVTEQEAKKIEKIEEEPATIRSLSNDFISVDFTTRGGAIKQVHFLKTKQGGPDTFVFNSGAALPSLGLSFRGPESELSYKGTYEIVEAETTATKIVFERKMGGGIAVRRSYEISPAGDSEEDAYLIRHETEFINHADQPLESSTGVYVNLGTVYSLGNDKRGDFLNFGYFNGEDTEFIGRKVFEGSGGILGIGAREARPKVQETVSNLYWGVVKNQYFAFVATVGEGMKSNGFFTTETHLTPAELASDTDTVDAVRASLAFPISRIDAGESKSIELEFYTGPKEFKRLSKLGDHQEEVMQFGFFGFFSKILMFFLYGIHSVIPSWGWSIVVMTIIIKVCFWPLTAKAAASQKRMRKIQEPLKEIREKFKDNPQKMQKETMRLFRENKVNPAAGCLPIFIQMPIFFGLFWMLRTASELRYAPFLWINDLSQPDTVAYIFDFPINILPLIMGVTMFFQMRMTPAMASGDATQQKIMKFLPFIFLIFLYNFSSGLVVYWTVQNLLTILQQYITNKRDDVANEPVVIPGNKKKKKRISAKK